MSARREEHSLKREVGWYGSFSMGYADVGADIYIALGLVALYAWGGAPLAFLAAASAYVATGLAYAELASTYPYAGGAQVYSMKATNDLMGFLAGWVIMLDYIVDIALFSMASAGYLFFIFPQLKAIHVYLGPAKLGPMAIVSMTLIAFLIAINLVGVRESSRFNEVMVTPSLIVQLSILILGFALAFSPALFLRQVRELGAPFYMEVTYSRWMSIRAQNTLYGLTLAMSSFIGIESIAQAAEETRRPYKWIPRASKLSVAVVLFFCLGMSVLALGVMPLREFTADISNPLSVLSSRIPYVGRHFSMLVAVTGFLVTLASANTGVIGVSRVVFSMGKFKLLPRWFYSVHPKTRTPVRTILVFGLMGALLTALEKLERVADLYNFGALLSYIFVHYSLIALRNRDKEAYRPWKTPVAVRVKGVELPLVGVFGLASCTAIWLMVVAFHPTGRVLGFLWLLAGMLVYTLYRWSSRLPVASRLGAQMVAPGMVKFHTLVLVRLPEKLDSIADVISRNLSRNFTLHLMSIIDPSVMKPESVEAVRLEAELELERLASSLRKRGFDVTHEAAIGDVFGRAAGEASKPTYDFVVVFRRRKARLKDKGAEKSMTEHLTSIVGGKLIALKKRW